MHFVLELIQNADDNIYANLIKPSLIFLIEKDKITLFNNELGFKQTHINAICDVKASTKSNHVGYIGRKGIGFKSVFTVTNEPEIHSNNYHVKFDIKKNGHIGYILPNWIETNSTLNSLTKFVSNRLDKLKNFDQNLIQIGSLNTCIHLPLKSESEMQRHKSSLLTNNFQDIKSYLLLFLNRLKYLILLTKEETKIFFRNDLNENLIELQSISIDSLVKQKWLLVKQSLTVTDNLKPDKSVEITDLCLAFPIYDEKEEESRILKLDRMDVFAYLPLRSFGFKFIIQADFVVPASRQDIREDSDWNQWLIKQIPKLFLKSFDLFKQVNNESVLNALIMFLRFVPLEEEILGCFQHVPRQILDLLRNEQCLPCIDNNDEIIWKKPFECLILNETNDLAMIRQVLTSDLLEKHLGRYYLHASLVSNINSKLLESLGVHYLNVNDLIEILESVFDSTATCTDIKSTAKWLVILQHCLKLSNYSIQQEEKFIKKLQNLPFIPINGNKRISLDKTIVFFPLLHNKNKLDLEIESDLNLIDNELLACLNNEIQNQQIISILKQMGVKQIQPNDVIEFHLTPQRLQNNKDEKKHILYLMYLQKYATSLDINKLKDYLLVKTTNKGFLLAKDVYLTPIYCNKYDLKKLFPSYDWPLIDSIYLNSTESMINWRKFLISIGVYDLFMPSSDDYDCKIVNFYTTNASNLDELTQLFRIIEENWNQNSHLPKALNLFKYIDSDKSIESVYFKKLKQSKWIPTTLNELERPDCVFIREPIFTRYYGQLVGYALNQPNKTNLSFSIDLGFKFDFNKFEFLKIFQTWISSNDKLFHASILQMKNIYKLFGLYLNSFETEKEILISLNTMIESKQNFIFIPIDDLSGKFYSNDQVYWSDPSGLFSKYKNSSLILIEPFYCTEKMCSTFIDLFKINKSPDLSHYIDLIEYIAQLASTTTNESNNEFIKDVYDLYEIIVNKCIEMSKSESITESVKANLIELIKDKRIIPCYNNKWLSIIENPILVDNNTDLAEKFINKFDMVIMPTSNESCFAEKCRVDYSNIKKQTYFLINLLDLKLFSKTVLLDLENITENLREAPNVQFICSSLLPAIQCFLFYRIEFKQIYQDLNNSKDKLINMKFYSVKELQNIYRCKHDTNLSVIVSNKSCFDTNEKSVYWKYFVRADLLNNEKEIIKGYVKLFINYTKQSLINEQNEKDLINFCLLMHQFCGQMLNDEDINEIEKDNKIKLKLPLNEIKWSIIMHETDFKIDSNSKKLKTIKQKPEQQSPQINQRLVYEQLSHSQINIPTTSNPSQMSQLTDKIVNSLATKMSANFKIENLNKRKLVFLNVNNEDLKQDKIEWSNLMINSFRKNLNQTETNYMFRIGRWGEIWVNEMLKKQYEYEICCGLVRIEWVNELEETGLPFDFKIIFKNNSNNEQNIKYIEVKSTTKMNQEAFPISYNEIMFAHNNSSQFQIYRLYNAGCDDPNLVEIKIIQDLPLLLNTHKINLFIII
jgi:hypothetical protein